MSRGWGHFPAGPPGESPAARKGAGAAAAAGAFTLLEVMIALAIFFMAVFAILGAVSQGLQGIRSLQVEVPDVGLLLPELMFTNVVEEGLESGDFGELYPEFRWERDIFEVATNGLYRVDFRIYGSRLGRPYETRTSVLLWRPQAGLRLPGGRPR